MSGLLASASPVRQARPYPRRGSRRMRAPIFEAISGVPSVELLSTTKTSVTISAGRSAKTRAMDYASLCVGMTTDTRTPPRLSSKPRRGRPATGQERVKPPRAAWGPDCQPKRCKHRNQARPNPRRAPFRPPKAGEIQKRHEGDRTRQQTEDEQDSETDFGDGL